MRASVCACALPRPRRSLAKLGANMGQELSTKQVDEWFLEGYKQAFEKYQMQMREHKDDPIKNPKPTKVKFTSEEVEEYVKKKLKEPSCCCVRNYHQAVVAIAESFANLHTQYDVTKDGDVNAAYNAYFQDTMNLKFPGGGVPTPFVIEGNEMAAYYAGLSEVREADIYENGQQLEALTGKNNRPYRQTGVRDRIQAMGEMMKGLADQGFHAASHAYASYAPYAPVRIPQQHTAFALLPTEAELEEAMMLNSGRDRSASDTLQ